MRRVESGSGSSREGSCKGWRRRSTWGWGGQGWPLHGDSVRKLELLTEVGVYVCMRPGPPAHTRMHAPQSPRNSGSSQKLHNNRHHTPEKMGDRRACLRSKEGAGAQEDQEGWGSSVAPSAASEPRWTGGSAAPSRPSSQYFLWPGSGLGPVETVRNMVPALRGNQSVSQGTVTINI